MTFQTLRTNISRNSVSIQTFEHFDFETFLLSFLVILNQRMLIYPTVTSEMVNGHLTNGLLHSRTLIYHTVTSEYYQPGSHVGFQWQLSGHSLSGHSLNAHSLSAHSLSGHRPSGHSMSGHSKQLRSSNLSNRYVKNGAYEFPRR